MADTEFTLTEEKQKQLRAPFGPEHVGLLPKVTCPDCSNKNVQCQRHNKAKCQECGAYISTQHIHLDYVGHGAVTDRLLDVDPLWTWEPLAFDQAGMPTFVYDRNNNPTELWIKLTVCGKTMLGVGTCPSGQFDAAKVLIGDALRNAAMRFGVALDLWIKGHAEDDERTSASEDRPAPERGVQPSKEVSVIQVTEVAGRVFKTAGDEAPKGQKTLVRDRLRHAVIWAATKGRTASLKDCTPEDLAAVHGRLKMIEAGTVTFTHDHAGVVFSAPQGARAVLWNEFEVDTNTPTEGAGSDGPASGGDAAPSGDGAHSHDVGRTGSEPAPTRQGEGEESALHGSSPEPAQGALTAFEHEAEAIADSAERHAS